MLGAVLGLYDSTPFFTGTTSLATDVLPNTIGLGGRIYPIDLRGVRVQSQETLRDGAVVSSEADDSLFNANGAWARYRRNWHYGAGQTIADFDKESNEFRFDTSVGIDPWERGCLELLPSTSNVLALSNAGTVTCINNGYLYVSDGTALKYTTDMVTWNTATAPGGTILSMSSDGTTLYVATSTLCTKYLSSAPGTPVAFGTAVTGNCTLVAFVANRLLLAKDNILYEVAAAGTLTTIWTHFQTTFKWTTVFAVGSRIYVGGYSGQRSELYSTAVTSAGALATSAEAVPLPVGELLYNAGSYAGVVLLCTNKGARLATIGGDSTLTFGPLITGPGAVRGACFDGRFAWVTGSTHPSNGLGVWRLALDTSVAPLQPAYASDVYETTTVSAPVTSVLRFLDRTVFVVDGTSVWAASATAKVTEGRLTSGELYFGTVEDKALTELKVIFEPLVTGTSVTAYVYDDRLTQLGTVQGSAAQDDSMFLDLDGTQVRHAMVELLLRGNGTLSPHVHAWRLRAYPVPPAVTQWVLPLIIHTRTVVGDGMGQELTYDVLAEAEQIQHWHAHRESITLQIGERAYRVRVDAYELQPANWDDEGAFFQHTLVVRLVSA